MFANFRRKKAINLKSHKIHLDTTLGYRKTRPALIQSYNFRSPLIPTKEIATLGNNNNHHNKQFISLSWRKSNRRQVTSYDFTARGGICVTNRLNFNDLRRLLLNCSEEVLMSFLRLAKNSLKSSSSWNNIGGGESESFPLPRGADLRFLISAHFCSLMKEREISFDSTLTSIHMRWKTMRLVLEKKKQNDFLVMTWMKGKMRAKCSALIALNFSWYLKSLRHLIAP